MEEETGAHSSILAWKILWTEEPGRLQSWGRKESDTTEQLSTHTGNEVLVLQVEYVLFGDLGEGGDWFLFFSLVL